MCVTRSLVTKGSGLISHICLFAKNRKIQAWLEKMPKIIKQNYVVCVNGYIKNWWVSKTYFSRPSY